ncbi:reverse transcriptase domain-containing protein [Tanacetum coccineum]|uniref:Reverse transcriptase domain-containing protein n=1 Tax=Tanacetum coccineum TaxID=301880 RepID=A0ABQ5A3Y2_9ASTR
MSLEETLSTVFLPRPILSNYSLRPRGGRTVSASGEYLGLLMLGYHWQCLSQTAQTPYLQTVQTEYGGGVRRRLMAVVGDWQCLVVAYGGCGNGGFSWLESAGVRWSVATVSGEMEKKMVKIFIYNGGLISAMCDEHNHLLALHMEVHPYVRHKLNIVVQKPEFDPGNGPVASEDRISSLPDELIHKILSFVDTKYAVQTSMLSSRWKLIWKAMPCLDFASYKFCPLPKFSKFVTNVLSHRNHQIDVSSVKLDFDGAASKAFARKIANYAFSHNVQELTVTSWPQKDHEFPPCLFSSQTLKHFTFSSSSHHQCLTPKTPWNFPALTTLHLSEITLCDDNCKSVDLSSKCVNLRNLTLETFLLVPNFSRLALTSLSYNFLLEYSPNATFVMDLPEPPPTKAMKAKAVREKNAKLVTEIELHMKELQALVEHGNKILVQTETTKVNLKNLITEVQVWTTNKMTQSEEVKQSIDRLGVQLTTFERQIKVMSEQGFVFDLKRRQNTPDKTLTFQDASSSKLIQASEPSSVAAINTPDKTLTFQDASSSKLIQASEPSSVAAIHKDFWTEEEDRILIAAHAEMGNKWSKWPRPSPIFQNYIKSLNLPRGRMNSNRSNNDHTHTLPVVKPLSSVTELEDFGFNDVLEFPMDEKLLEWDDDNIQCTVWTGGPAWPTHTIMGLVANNGPSAHASRSRPPGPTGRDYRHAVCGREKTSKETDAAPRVNILDFCEEHYEDILPVIMDKIRRDKRKEVHNRLDFGDIPREVEEYERALKTQVRGPCPQGHRRQSAFDRLSDTYSPSTTKSGSDKASSRDYSHSRGRPHRQDSSLSMDRPRSRDHSCGIEESYGNTCSSYRTGARHGYHSRDRDRPRIMKKGRESESPLSRVSESGTSDGGHWKSKSKRHKPTDEDDLAVPWSCEEVDPFTPRIRNFKSSRKTRMPNNVKTYEGTRDPQDHVKNFEAATQVERWAMPTWCHMFNSTLIGTARVWFDELPPESIEGYKDLKAAFLAYFMQQKKYVKDPVESTISSRGMERPSRIS